MLTKSLLYRPTCMFGAELLIVVAIGAMISGVMPHLSARSLALLNFLLALTLLGGGWAIFKYEKILMDSIYPLPAQFTFISVLALPIYRHLEGQRRSGRRVFGPPDVIGESSASGEVRGLLVIT